LAHVTNKAIQYFDQKKNVFFLMIEGSQIDWGGHNNDLNYTVSELIDFDKAVKIAYDYAQSNKNTLVIVTADHETGGLSLIDGSEKNKEIKPHYSTGHHTGIMVPVYAFGPGSHLFRGTMENTQVYKNIKYLLKL
jgi:alkaline phosphatase